MKRLVSMAAVGLSAVLLMPLGVAGQNESDGPGASPVPVGSPMPWPEYKALVSANLFPDLEAEVAAASFRPLTGDPDEARITAFREHLLDTIDILETVVPEPCYAQVHATVLEMAPWFVAFHDATTAADIESWDDLLAAALPLGEQAAERWPFVVSEPEGVINIGPYLEWSRVFDLATCEASADGAPTVEPSEHPG